MRISRFILLALAALVAAPVAARAQAAQADSAFAVSKNGSSLLRVNQDGKVGIGTSTPNRTLTVVGTIGASDTVATGVGIRFPDGSVQTTAAANAVGTSSNTPNTLVKRDSTGSFAAGKVTLDSLSVAGRTSLGHTATGRLSAGDTVSSSAGFKFPDGSVQTTAAATASGVSTNTPNTIVGRDANGNFAAGEVTLDSLAVSGTSRLGTARVTGVVSATDTVASSVGFKFPDGSVQTTAATTATGTSANTPNTLVQRDANGGFAAGKVTLDSVAVSGQSTLGATATGRLSASDTVSSSVGFKFPDGSVQTTAAAAAATGTSANTPNTLVQRDANGGFSAGKVTLDSAYVNGRAQLGSGDVIVERVSALANDNDSIFTVRNGTDYGFRVDRDAGVLARGFFNGGPSGSGVPTEGSGLRMMWYPGKGAFRAGAINGTQWDDANIGTYSAAMGLDVRASGDYAVALGQRAVAANIGTFAFGEDVTATGANSVVMGYRASTSTGAGSPRLGTFVFGDRSTSATGDTVHATTTNAAFWRVANGFYIWTASNLASGVAIQSGSSTTSPWCSITDAVISASNCAYLSSGGAWTNSSDRNRKHGFADVSGEDVLARLRNVPITTWTYNNDPEQVRHLGPMAQDFHAAFGLGGADETHIATVDADGVSLAAVKALDARTQAQQARIEALERENAELRARLERIERLLESQAAPKP